MINLRVKMIFKLIARICCFRAAPEDIPYSIPLLLGIAGVNLAMLFFIILLATASAPTALWKSLLLMSLIAGFTYAVTAIQRLPERFVQTLSGLLATKTFIITTLALPSVILSWVLLENPSSLINITGYVICGLLTLTASLWLFFIYSKIFQHSLEITISQSLLVSLLLFGLNLLVFGIVRGMLY